MKITARIHLPSGHLHQFEVPIEHLDWFLMRIKDELITREVSSFTVHYGESRQEHFSNPQNVNLGRQ